MVEQQIMDFDAGDIEIPMFLEEGTCTVTDDIDSRFGTDSNWVFSARLRKGDIVVLHTVDRTVIGAGTGVTEIFGKIIDTPRFNGPRPVSTQTTGNYDRRIATVRVFGSGVYPVELEAINTAVAIGQSVKVGASTVGKFDLFHATNKNNTRAIQVGGASSGAKIGIVFGFYGSLI